MKRGLITLLVVGFLGIGNSAVASSFAIQAGAGVVNPNTDLSLDNQTWLFASLRIPLFMEDFYLEPEIARWTHPSLVEIPTADDFEDLQIGGNLVFTYPFSRFELFFGGGLALHRLDGDLTVAGLEPSTGGESRFGARFMGGLDILVHPHFSLFGAVRYQIVFNAELEQLIFYGGARIRF